LAAKPAPGTPEAILRELARSFKSTVRSTNECDWNVARTPLNMFAADRTPPPDYFSKRVKIKLDGMSLELKSCDVFLKIELNGKFLCLPFSVNREDIIDSTKPTAVALDHGRLPVYVNPRRGKVEDITVLNDPRAQGLLAAIITHSADSVHCYVQQIWCYKFAPASGEAVLRTSRDLLAFMELLPVAEEPAPIALPPEFSELTALANRWSISDDNERGDAIDEASPKDLQELVAAIEPLYPQINAYLDAHEGADESVILMFLAECAMEAELHLKNS
jgi:hypothetical protein